MISDFNQGSEPEEEKKKSSQEMFLKERFKRNN
jgi:hypothetical protein